MVPLYVRLRPFVRDVIVVSSVVAAVRQVLIKVSSDGEAFDWEFSIGVGLDLFLSSFVEAIRDVSSLFGIVVLFPVVCIPKKYVMRSRY